MTNIDSIAKGVDGRIARRRAEWTAKHDGHETKTQPDGRRRCLTCQERRNDIDPMAVELAVAGRPPDGLTIAERDLAVIQLRSRGLSLAAIGRRIGCHSRTVSRIVRRTESAPEKGNS